MTDVSFLRDLPLDDEQFSTTDAARESHARDWGTPAAAGVRPDAVVWPESTEDVSVVLSAADERGVPVTPYAAATGIEAGAVAVRGGISLDLTRMDDVLGVHPDDFLLDVEPGVTGGAVDETTARHGLFFPPLPTSGNTATVGGMVATNAGGRRTVRYGKIGDWVRQLEVVLADGSVVTLGSRAAKSSSGYNLRDLVVGSEGTLAVVTRATLELAGRPEQVRGGHAVFDTLADATAAVADVMRAGVDVASLELVDETSVRMVNDYVDADLPVRPMVFFEFHADHHVDAEVDYFRGVVDRHDPLTFALGDRTEMADLWEVRRELADATLAYDPSLETLHSGDVAVPISRYPDVVEFIHEAAAEAELLIPTFGHAGDGNVHFDVLVDPDDEAAVARGEAAVESIVTRAIDLGGTATGEHGVGRGKRRFMAAEHGREGVAAMRALKAALDPNGTLNPGKVLPDEV
jgi:D-lactate dehydrogenase (cytochrome)